MTASGFTVVPDQLRRQSLPIAEAAKALRRIEPVATGALTDGDLLTSAVLSPGTALRAERAILHAITNDEGLGLAAAGSTVADLLDGVGTALGREGLAERIATDALQLRIAAVVYEHPELANHQRFNDLVAALDADDQIEAARLLGRLTGELGDVATVLPELLALNALLDENPANDPVGWDLLDGRIPRVDPITGLIDLETLSGIFDTGPGHAEPAATPEGVTRAGATPSVQSFLSNVDALDNGGRMVVQSVVGPDGVTRFVVQLPGMQFGNPVMTHPQDLAGAVHNAVTDQSSYTRAVQLALRQAGVPHGADVAIVGHSLGGITAANLAQDPAFNGDYHVTHVVSVGSPVDGKGLPPGSDTQLISIVNDRDVVPALDGRGAGSPHDPAGGRVEYRFSSPDQFPASHEIAVYLRALDGVYGPVGPDGGRLGDHLNTRLGLYTGPGSVVERTQTYQLRDEPPR